MEIRRYQPGDSEVVQRLNEEVIRAVGIDPADLPRPRDIADIEGSYIEPGGEFLVAEVDTEVVGMGGLRVDSHEGELFRMRVALSHQREGIGSRLLTALESAARERGVELLRAETAKRQSGAVAFYPRNGYERVDAEQRGEYTVFGYEKEL